MEMYPHELSRDQVKKILLNCELFEEYHDLVEDEDDDENYIYFRNTETGRLIEFEVGTSLFELVSKLVYIYYDKGWCNGIDYLRDQFHSLMKLEPDPKWKKENKD